MKQMNKRYTEVLNGMSDEEFVILCNNLVEEAVAQDIYTEAGVDDLSEQCCRFVKKMSHIPLLGAAAVNINLFCGMLKDSVKKDYYLSLKTKGIILGALTYLIMPVDLIPDALPIIGVLDDITVLRHAAESLQKELADYKNYLLENNRNSFVDAVNAAAAERFYGNNEAFHNNYAKEAA